MLSLLPYTTLLHNSFSVLLSFHLIFHNLKMLSYNLYSLLFGLIGSEFKYKDVNFHYAKKKPNPNSISITAHLIYPTHMHTLYSSKLYAYTFDCFCYYKMTTDVELTMGLTILQTLIISSRVKALL